MQKGSAGQGGVLLYWRVMGRNERVRGKSGAGCCTGRAPSRAVPTQGDNCATNCDLLHALVLYARVTQYIFPLRTEVDGG